MVTNHLAQNENVVLIKLHTYVLHYGMQWQQLKKHRKLQKKKKKKKQARGLINDLDGAAGQDIQLMMAAANFLIPDESLPCQP